MTNPMDKLDILAQKARQRKDDDFQVNLGPVLARIKAGHRKSAPALAWFTAASCLASAVAVILITSLMDTINNPLVYLVVSMDLF